MMDEDHARAALAGTRFGDVRVVAETGSTNADVLGLARAGAPEGVVVVADHQTAGRGRLERRWEAPPGSSLLLSVLTRPVTGPLGLPVEALHRVSTALGIAAAEAVDAVAGVPARLKWPNDLVVDVDDGDGVPRKLSGILAETQIEAGTVAALVVGIGINVNWPEPPPELAGTATALNLARAAGSGGAARAAGSGGLARAAGSGGPARAAGSGEAASAVDRDEVLVALLERFDHWYGRMAEPTGAAELLARYRSLSATLGRRVRVELPGEVVEGDAYDLTADGHLLVIDDCPDRPREITVGDVIHLRVQ